MQSSIYSYAFWSQPASSPNPCEGAVFEATDPDGKEVIEGELFATMLQAVGILHINHYQFGQRPIPLVNYGIEPIRQILT